MSTATARCRPRRSGAWKYAFIYDIVPRYYPDLQERARPISRREAQRKLVLRHLNNVVAGSRSDVFKALDVLGWTHAEFDSAIAMMIERDDIYELATSGRKEPLLVSKRT